ncbi:hypothetical protein LWI28_015905 [Acer negundo]|uniref:EGF-like domain-containing protein n=1 Tax=Acer negundo TaxID=4023 RepID=A0AAD5IZL8_ACENE|nr:hypothetical protein LWI28_015905 [Acer negundo]
MSMKLESMYIFIVMTCLLLGSLQANSLPCGDDSRCKTEQCNSTDSACICNLPDPSTILDGDRSFLGGEFCDEEMTMCDGTNTFWCEHGGTCEEIVQGEKYFCKCRPGFTGEQCELSGVSCGQIFCFHEAQCLVEDGVCDCSPDWKGSLDCSLPTKPLTDYPTTSTTTKFPEEEISNNTNWAVVVLAISGSTGAIAGGAIFIKKLFGKKTATVPKFRQLSQMQSHDMLDDDDDEDDSMIPNVIHRDTSHL